MFRFAQILISPNLSSPGIFEGEICKKVVKCKKGVKESTKTTAPRDSHVLTNRSTRRALTSLTSGIERDRVFSGRYGRSCPIERGHFI